MRVLYEIKDKFEAELKKIADKKELSPVDLEATYKIVDILKDIETICAMDEYGDEADDWSGRSYGRRTSRAQYSGYGMSGRRYSGGYSGYGSDRMLENLYKAMDDAESEDQRMAIMSIINKMK